MNQNEKLMKNIEMYEKRTGTEPLEKIIIITSKPFETGVTREDPATGSKYSDTKTTSGKMIFLGDKKKLERCMEWLKEVEQYENIDELYIYDRYHKSGEDMIKRATMKLHEFSYAITLKDEFKKCWWNGEVSGCKLWSEYALDPENKRW